MVKRILLVLVVAIGFFAWGVATGVYRGFPWPTVYAVGQQVTGILRQIGLMRPRPEDVPPPQRVTSQVNSGLLNFDLTVINSANPLPGQGGGMALTRPREPPARPSAVPAGRKPASSRMQAMTLT